jgi:hypothetical protein
MSLGYTESLTVANGVDAVLGLQVRVPYPVGLMTLKRMLPPYQLTTPGPPGGSVDTSRYVIFIGPLDNDPATGTTMAAAWVSVEVPGWVKTQPAPTVDPLRNATVGGSGTVTTMFLTVIGLVSGLGMVNTTLATLNFSFGSSAVFTLPVPVTVTLMPKPTPAEFAQVKGCVMAPA